MYLIPEQVLGIRNIISTTEKKKQEFKEYQTERGNITRDDTFGYRIYDDVTDCHYKRLFKELDNSEYLLSTSQIISRPTITHIEIGTKFWLSLNQEKPEKYVLVETVTGMGLQEKFITATSPLGRELYGKTTGTDITYKVPLGTQYATITEIVSSDDEYMKMLKRKANAKKTCRRAKQKIHNSLEDGTYQNEWLVMSPSQEKLLTEELSYLIKENETRKNPKVDALIHGLKWLLTRYKTVTPPTDDTIGVGSQISIALKDKEKNLSIIDNIEFINRALSTELDGLYIERITPLGSALHGLKKDDVFNVRIDNKNYTGIVTNVCNRNYLTLPKHEYKK